MLSPEERDDIRREVLNDLIEIEDEIATRAGSYSYLCLIDGAPTFCHTPCGPIIRRIVRLESAVA